MGVCGVKLNVYFRRRYGGIFNIFFSPTHPALGRGVWARRLQKIRDFMIRDATPSRTRWLINGLGLERRRLRGKSKVKIPFSMHDDAAAKRSLSVWFFGISFAEIAMPSFEKVHEMLCLCLIDEIIDEEEFVLLCEAHRPSSLPFPRSANSNEKVSLANNDPAEGKADFRVEKRDIPLLVCVDPFLVA